MVKTTPRVSSLSSLHFRQRTYLNDVRMARPGSDHDEVFATRDVIVHGEDRELVTATCVKSYGSEYMFVAIGAWREKQPIRIYT